jgi:hypothetical protein
MVIRHTLQKLSSVMIGRPPALAAPGSSPTLQLQRSTPPHWQTHLTLSRTTRRSPHSTCSIVSSIALSSFLCNNCHLHLLRHFPSVASLRPAKPATPNQQLPPRSTCGHPGWHHALAGLFRPQKDVCYSYRSPLAN